MDRVALATWAPPAIPFLRSPNPLQKMKKRTHFLVRDRQARVGGASRKNTTQSQFSSALPKAVSVRAHGREDPLRRQFQSNPAEPAYVSAHAGGPPR